MAGILNSNSAENGTPASLENLFKAQTDFGFIGAFIIKNVEASPLKDFIWVVMECNSGQWMVGRLSH